VNQQEEGTGYFFDHRSWGQAAFSKNKKQPVPEKQSAKKLPVPVSHSAVCCFSLVFLLITLGSERRRRRQNRLNGSHRSTLPLEIAARNGFFRDEGLEILTITVRTNIAVNALITRNVKHGAKWQTLDWRYKLLIISDLPNGA
jgi:hypothetical protein